MHKLPACSIRLAIFLCLIPLSISKAQVIGFEDLSTPPATNSAGGLQYANNNSLTYDGIVWDSRIDVVGKDYEINSSAPAGPLYSGGAPSGGNYYITNDTSATGDPATTYGNGITLTTSQVLIGADFGSVEYYGYGVGEGASQVSVTAMDGSTALSTLTFNLTLNTQTGGYANTAEPMTYFNTSSFLGLSGITGYVINRTPYNPANLQYGAANWVADNFNFVTPGSAPEPSSGFLAFLATLVLGGCLGLRHLRIRA